MPQYTVGASIYFDSMQNDLAEFREVTRGEGDDLDTDPWTKENVLGDAFSLIMHFFLWFFILFLIEMGLCKTLWVMLSDVTCGSAVNDESFEYEEDDDVIEE